MGDTWITDMRHYLEENGAFPVDMPGPALNLAIFLGAIVAWVTRQPNNLFDETNVGCRRSPNRKRCLGDILARIDEDTAAIEWHCPVCGDNGVIRGWESTRWDRSMG